MNKATTNTLVAVAVILLAVDVVIRLAEPAEAQPHFQQAPRVVQAFQAGSFKMLRVWSDGVIEWRGFEDCGQAGRLLADTGVA